MTVTCVLQARMGSTRRPGKVLADVGGRPLLALILERLQPLKVDHLVVATSDLARDDPVARLAAESGALVARGSETDVLDRFATAVEQYPADLVVRLTADCPLIDPEIVAAALDLQRDSGADYASNTLVRTFPDGLDVEVLTAAALREAASEAVDPFDREHVTPFVYRQPDRYAIAQLRTAELLGDERWTVDTDDDLRRVRAIVASLPSPAVAGWHEILSVAARRGSPPRQVDLKPGSGDVEIHEYDDG